ncbi:hypothetical protein [Streptomyces purpurascens]|uniref:hypothetical protein n=1 Tax=Streptomyces purpurascens TaxID=1924 RepID=UPI001673D4EA|nr:hypothetical protein [Streptomyces purpurascens]MCE7051327.1 hypothetical protein [Streptomyces purpurascens]GHA52667.1 hypothetical protein GCM10010303_75670 [Streptomyces purpurascens]
MVEYVDNPAGRLRKLLRDLYAHNRTDQMQKQKPAWTAILELADVDGNLAREMAVIGAAVGLPAQVREAVHALPVDDDRKEHLLDHLAEVEDGLSKVLTRQSLWTVFTTFAPGGIVPQSAASSSLSHCSYELHSHAPEPTVSDEDLAQIIQMIHELMVEVADADLPDVVKRAMLNHLVILSQTANNVRFAGTQPLDDALFALMGAASRANAQEDLERVGLWDKFKSAVQTLGSMLSTGQSATQLGQGIAGVLGG